MAEMELTSACRCCGFSFLVSKGSAIMEIIKKNLKKGTVSWKLLNQRLSALASLALCSPCPQPHHCRSWPLLHRPGWSLSSRATLVDLSGSFQAPGPRPRSHLSVDSRPSSRLRPLRIYVLAALGCLSGFALDPAISPTSSSTPLSPLGRISALAMSPPSLHLHPCRLVALSHLSLAAFCLFGRLMKRRARKFGRTGMAEFRLSTGQQDHVMLDVM